MAYLFPLITKPKADFISKERTVIYLHNLGIPNTNEFGKCEFLRAKPPMGTHAHENSFEVCYHVRGRQMYYVADEAYETKGGQIFITFPNEVHDSSSFIEEKSTFFYFSFNCMPDTTHFLSFDEETSAYIKNCLFHFTNRQFKGSENIKNLLQSVMDIYFSDKEAKRARIVNKLLEFFFELIDLEQASHKPPHKVSGDIEKVVDYISEHPWENFRLEDLAGQIYLSESWFKYKFKKAMGVPPNEYILENKINLSKEMLVYTNMTIAEIAHELSFSSSQYYAAVFKKHTNSTPTEYRNQKRQNRRY